MRRKYQITLGILAFLIVCCMFMGSSYALWRVTNYQSSTNLVETGCFDVSFKDVSSSINLSNAYPIEDTKGLQTTPYVFTIKNNCSIKANYSVYLNSLNINNGVKMADQNIKYSLVKNSAASEVGNLLTSATLNSDSDYTGFNVDGKTYDIASSYVLDTGTLANGEVATYSLKLWINSAATTEINNQKFEAAISTVATPTDDVVIASK